MLLLLAACSGGPELGGERGEKPTIVSLNPCTDAILAEVADPGQLLAISHYSKDPRASSMKPEVAARYVSTGGTVEEILALQPDIVVASTFIAPATRAALDDLGVRVETFGSVSSVEESMDQVRQIARLTGNAGKSGALVASIDRALLDANAKGRPVEAGLWQPAGIVPGEGALISDLLRRTGFTSYGAARGMAQADYLSLEQVVADPPEVLLVAGSEAGQRHPVLATLPQMRRESFDTSLLYCGGPTIIRAAERLAQIRKGVS
nr:ABC transporter substrate-binding protein [Qipengyuania intermedia]